MIGMQSRDCDVDHFCRNMQEYLKDVLAMHTCKFVQFREELLQLGPLDHQHSVRVQFGPFANSVRVAGPAEAGCSPWGEAAD